MSPGFALAFAVSSPAAFPGLSTRTSWRTRSVALVAGNSPFSTVSVAVGEGVALFAVEVLSPSPDPHPAITSSARSKDAWAARSVLARRDSIGDVRPHPSGGAVAHPGWLSATRARLVKVRP